MSIFKSIWSLVLAGIIMLSVTSGLDMSVLASETEAETQEVTEVIEVTEATEVYEATEGLGATDSSTETQATEAPTVITTEGVTEVESDATEAPTEEPSYAKNLGSVGTLYKDTNYTDRIEFSWNSVEDADGYRVYYKNDDIHDDFRLLTITEGTELTVMGLDHTTPYEFKVAPFVVKFGKTYEGTASIGKTATQPAATSAPTLKRCSTVIEISWNKNDKADGYRIYRQDASTNGKLVLYKTITNNSTTTFSDTNISQGRAYNYHVKAYREMYEGRTYLGEGATLRTLAGLCAPGGVTTTSQLSRVSFVWNKNKYADGYDIMYSTSKTGTYKLLRSTTKTFFNTIRLTNNTKYYFRIVPYKQVGNYRVLGTYTPVEKTVTNKAYGKTIGNTYIEISIKQQYMWYYIDGTLYVETPVVTGNVGAYSTPTGAYSIYQRMSPATLTGPTWCTTVQYWLAFTYSGCGIHDASWRSASEFGGTTYMGNGSHGCVNTPTAAVKKIYSKAKIGTPVVVY